MESHRDLSKWEEASLPPPQDKALLQETSVHEMNSSLSDQEASNASQDSRPHYRTKHRLPVNIVLAAIMITVPFLLIVGVLLYLINAHRVEREGDLSLPALRLPKDTDDKSAYLVDFSATQLTTLASWSSNVATILPVFVMTVFSYRVAHILMGLSDESQVNKLPTPYQLGLLFGALDAKLMILWNGLTYLFWKRRSQINIVLYLTFGILLVGIALSGLIWGADTWFHVTVSTILFSQILPSTSSPQAYGFRNPDVCAHRFEDSRILRNGTGPCLDKIGLEGDADGYQIIANASTKHQVLTTLNDGTRYSFLAPSDFLPNLDFVTSTVAVSTTCQSIGQRCGLKRGRNDASDEALAASSSLTFSCSNEFFGNVTTINMNQEQDERHIYNYSHGCTFMDSPGCLDFFTDDSLNSHIFGGDFSSPLKTASDRYANPFYAGVLGNAATLSTAYRWLHNPPHSVETTPYSRSYWFLLGCNTTVLDLTYSRVNGSIVSTDVKLADDNVADIMRTMLRSTTVFPEIAFAARLAVAQSGSLDEVASNYATNLERMMLAFSADMWTPVENTQEQLRRNILVARVPKAPLFTLISLCLLSVLLGIAVLVVASTGQTKQTQAVQARLNVFGIIADRFETKERNEAPLRELEDIFEERDGASQSTRIGIVKSRKGGWTYSSSEEQQGKE